MSEEEKKAIEIIKGLQIEEYEWYEKTKQIEGHEEEEAKKVRQAIDTIINLIEKQQKEIEERDKYNITTLPFEKIKEDIEQNKNISIFGKEYISKDKIREKIKELEEQMQQDEVDEFGIHSIGWGALDYFVEQLKELLKEK